MTEERNRDKVIAEITVSHLMRLAIENGCSVSREQALVFFNRDDRAQEMWKHMMQAGLDFYRTQLIPTVH